MSHFVALFNKLAFCPVFTRVGLKSQAGQGDFTQAGLRVWPWTCSSAAVFGVRPVWPMAALPARTHQARGKGHLERYIWRIFVIPAETRFVLCIDRLNLREKTRPIVIENDLALHADDGP